MKVFLGGTCNNSTWRNELMPMLKVDYFNPVVEDWTPECQEEELKQREECDICFYLITPEMTGVYSIAEVIDDSNKRPEKTVFCIYQPGETEFNPAQYKSLHGTLGDAVSLTKGISAFISNVKKFAEHSEKIYLKNTERNNKSV